MAIKSGDIIHDIRGVVIDRLQTAGGSIDVPSEKIDELGNRESVAVVRGIADLQFKMNSFDMSTEVEALITGVDSTAVTAGQRFDFRDAKELGVASPFKNTGTFTAEYGSILPWLTLESASYTLGLSDSATQEFNWRGDSIFYTPGAPTYEEYPVVGAGPYAFTDAPAIKFVQAGADVYALSVVLVNTTSGAQRRCKFGSDYTNTASGITFTANPSPAWDVVQVMYGSTVPATYPQSVHQGVGVKPADVRGRDIDIYVGNPGGTVFKRWTSVQSFNSDWSVSLESDEEFGNTERVSYGYSDTPEVSGSVGVKPNTAGELWSKLEEVSGVAPGNVIGASASTTLPIRAQLRKPDTAVVMKTIEIPKARFKIPAFEPSVNSKLEVSFDFESDDGVMYTYNGSPA